MPAGPRIIAFIFARIPSVLIISSQFVVYAS